MRCQYLFGLLALSIQAMAASEDPGLCHLMDERTPPFVDAKASREFESQYVSSLRTEAGSPKPWEVRTQSAMAGGPTLVAAKAFSDQATCLVWFTKPIMAALINTPDFFQVAGRKNPFPNIANGWKGVDPANESRVSYLVVGWIPRSIESTQESNGTYVIRMYDDEPGYLEYAVAITSAAMQKGTTWKMDAVMDYVASPAASKIMGQWFYVVPDNSLLQRRVRIDLVDRQTKQVVASTPCNDKSCFPQIVFGEVTYKKTDGSTARVCGKQSACPQFRVRPEFEVRGAVPPSLERPRPGR